MKPSPETDPTVPQDASTADDAAGGAKPRPRRRRPAPAAVAGDSATAAGEGSAQASAALAPPEANRLEVHDSDSANRPDGAVDASVSSERTQNPAEPSEEDGQREGRRRRRNRRRGKRPLDASASGAAQAPDAGPGREFPRPSPADVSEVFAAVLSGDFDGQADEPPATVESSMPSGLPDATLQEATSQGGQTVPVGSTEGMGDAAVSADTLSAGLAGSSDIEPDGMANPLAQAKRVLSPEQDAPKLHKVLAQSGVGSRRDLEQMIAEGRFAVNGEPAHVGQRISFGDRITLDGKPVKYRIAQPLPRVLVYHKPAGEVVTHDDPQARPTVFRKLPRLAHGKWQSVGRLDINTEGLLLFTNSGDLANRLMHPRFGVEREYAVRILGELDASGRDRLLQGVELDGHPAAFQSIEEGGGEGANRWYRVVINEGRHREVRRLFEAVGHVVSRLIRIRYGCVVLPKGLRRGVWVDLGGDDVKALRQLTGAPKRVAPSQPGGPKPSKRGPRRGRGPRPNGTPMEPSGLPRSSWAEEADGEELEHRGPIPNPLQQTFDKRAIQQARKRREYAEDGPIPNPLQQTYDKRAMQAERAPRREIDEDGPIPNPLQQTYDKRFLQAPPRKHAAKPGSPGKRRRPGGGSAQGPERQPDPMRTSVGYIGADAFHQKGRGGRRGGGRK